MKRFIFTAIAITTVAISCTKSNFVELPQTQQTPISFDTYTGKTPVTKAISETTTTLGGYTSLSSPAFHVKAFIPGVYTAVYADMDKDVWCTSMTPDNPETQDKNEYSATWDYDGTTYWPTSGVLEFLAYGSNAVDHMTFKKTETDGIETTSHTEFEYEVSDIVAEQEDLIVATPETTSTMPEGGKVTLEFKHLLSRVGFTLQTTESNSIYVTIKSIILHGDFYESGNVDLRNPEISTTGIQATANHSYPLFGTNKNTEGAIVSYDCFRINNVPSAGTSIYANSTRVPANGEVSEAIADKVGAKADNRFMMLIPKGVAKKAEIIYQIAGAKEEHVEADFEDITLVAGNAYEFIVRLSTESIEFEGTVVGWDTAETVTVPKED